MCGSTYGAFMTFAYITITPSPHQLPLCRAFVRRLPEGAFKFFFLKRLSVERSALGWNGCSEPWMVEPKNSEGTLSPESMEWALEADIVVTSSRDTSFLERRLARGRLTFYTSETWFKPPLGFLRLLSPSFLKMFLQFRRLSRNPCFFYLPTGEWAHKALRWCTCFGERSLQWGYFVEPSPFPIEVADSLRDAGNKGALLRILWVGRMLAWKRVDTVVKAVVALLKDDKNIRLRLIGGGPEEERLRTLTGQWLLGNHATEEGVNVSGISFESPLPIEAIREAMRRSDVYVLSSNGYEGWGTVVNEALAEGCCIVGSKQAGSVSALISNGKTGRTFNSGCTDELRDIFLGFCQDREPVRRFAHAGRSFFEQNWVPDVAAERLLLLSKNWLSRVPLTVFEEGPLAPSKS